MKAKFLGVEFFVSYPAVAFLSIAIICDKKGAVLLCFVSSILHEIGHIVAMKLKGAKLNSVAFNLGDVAINADCTMLSYSEEIFVSVSGVAVNLVVSLLSFILFFMSKSQPWYDLGLTNALLGVFNLLPVRFLDGGQLLTLLLQKSFTTNFSERIVNILTVIFLVPIGTLGLIFLFNSNYNYSLFFAALYLICTLVSKEFKNVS